MDSHTGRSRGRDEILLLALGLSLLCLVTKAILLPFPVSTAGEFVRWLLRLAIVVAPDICLVAGLATACLIAAWCCRRRGTRVVRIGSCVLFYLAAVYAVASVPIYRFTMVPLTLPSLYLMGGGESASSIGACVSVGTLVSLIVAPLAVVGGALLLGRFGGLARWLPRRKLAMTAMAGLIAAYGAVCHVYVKARWDDPNRWERRIAQSPHAVFVASCVAELWHADALEMFGDPDESDFVPRAAQPTLRLASFAKDEKRPRNVLLIVLESTSVEYVSLYRARYPTMPHLERLARERGVIFDNVYVQTPSSCQSLAALTASIYPRPDWGLMVRDEPDFDVPTIAEVLGGRGYRTCFAHSGYWRWKNRDRYLRSRGAQTLLDADNIAGEQVNTWGVADRAMFQATLDWIDEDRSRPFFALAYTIETHHPYVARGPLHDFGVSDPDFNRYLNALRATDETIAWVMDELRRRGLEDSTVVAVTADHGESFGQHNQRIHSFSVYESAVHVPLVLLHPSLRDDNPPRVADVARHIDIAPTLLDALGIDAPADWQGGSLLAPRTGGRVGFQPAQGADAATDPGRRAYFFATGNQVILGLRDGPYKYHYHLSTGHEELFDLSADPGEVTNLAASDEARCAAYKRKLGGFVSYQRRFLAKHRARKIALVPRLPSFPGSAWERAAREAPPRRRPRQVTRGNHEAEPHPQFVPGRSLGTRSNALHRQHEIEIRVRYPETDPGGYVHHAHYFTYFELGRTELLRAAGRTYRDMEQAGAYVVVVRAQCRYHRPARYDDLLRLRTTIARVRAATAEHEYHLYRGAELLAEAQVQVCCVDKDGNPQRWPEWMAIE